MDSRDTSPRPTHVPSRSSAPAAGQRGHRRNPDPPRTLFSPHGAREAGMQLAGHLCPYPELFPGLRERRGKGPHFRGDPEGGGAVSGPGRVGLHGNALRAQLSRSCARSAAFRSVPQGEEFPPKSGAFSTWCHLCGRVAVTQCPHWCPRVPAPSYSIVPTSYPDTKNTQKHKLLINLKQKKILCPNCSTKGNCKETIFNEVYISICTDVSGCPRRGRESPDHEVLGYLELHGQWGRDFSKTVTSS